ncbi:GGDEF domain-containing protein [Vibrio aestuarianus]|uniref:GGDEF domain-containing protein n=1 Tax=Vibrio aestuarianus TaxID=28171 RepID=A0ABD7YMC9_9VIBR|nr:GGDEF domain-containing protein [Vibrio aestuarianus]MDE1232316.1 GGDEF domain-containing protein [Vibrio aestuarianus]WGK86130.1 GGDEF domain-containing protein [Vibrio aestuarianus]CAH8194548.1 putative Diguanylate cyclase [Vibrio aestuarianus]
MAHDVHSFVADKLSEVVLTKHHRQRMMVFALTLFGIVFLGVFSAYCFYKGQTLLATTLAFYTGFGLLTVWLLTRWRTVGLVCLSAIIYSLSLYLVVTGGYEGTGVMWVYPLAAIGIFINQFKHGLLLSFLFITGVFITLAFQLSIYEYSHVMSIRLVITLIALSGMCHILIYFQSQMDDYILKMHEEGIHELAYIDSLTKLANRSSFNSVLYHSMQLTHHYQSAIIYIDLDNFKNINDRYGHNYGDIVLAEFGLKLKAVAEQYLQQSLGAYDVARIGGDEFAIYVKEYASEQDVVNMANEIIALFSSQQLSSLKKVVSDVGASIGIAFVDTEKMDLSDSLTIADRAMYQAKKAGKGKVCVAEVGSEIKRSYGTNPSENAW